MPPPAGDLTYQVLVVYAIGLPAYVATEVMTRGLISMRDTRTPLLTNGAQLALRIALITLLLGSFGTLAVPVAFMISCSLETLVLTVVLFMRLRSRVKGLNSVPQSILEVA